MKNCKEYANENNRPVEISKLTSPLLPKPNYILAHRYLVIPCHDVFIKYHGGILLVMRKNNPAKGIPWPIGGRIERGMSITDSLKAKVKDECGLELSNIAELGYARTFFSTDPFGHGNGTDTINFVFYAFGSGELKLDISHEKPFVMLPEDYPKMKDDLHPYVADFLKRIFRFF